MEKSIVLKLYTFCVVLTFCVLLAGIAGAETLHLADGQTVSGEMVSLDDKGIVLKQPDGSYGERIPWTKLSQADLKELQQNPRAAQFVEPFIEVTQADKMSKTEIDIKEVARLPRPTGHSLIAAMFTSAIGIFTLFLLYAGNIYAAYEISVFRAAGGFGLWCGGGGSIGGADHFSVHADPDKAEGTGMAAGTRGTGRGWNCNCHCGGTSG